jgi:hypothetical protein
MKPKFQDGNVRKVEYMPRNSATNEWSQLKRNATLGTENGTAMHVGLPKAIGVYIMTPCAPNGTLGFNSLLVVCSSLVPSILSILPFLPLEWYCKLCIVFWKYIAIF